MPFLHHTNGYGPNQWAFRPAHSCRDLVTLRVATWLMAAHLHKKSAVFLSDIAGAFDRVDVGILMSKCHTAGLEPTVCRFLRDFFRPRTACVIVQGNKSKPFPIENQVYQGTVLGPPAWNLFFKDVAEAVRETDFVEALFADDLTCERAFNTAIPNSHLQAQMQRCQLHVHRWGACNRVVFDPAK
jgi:hypothetical protein